MKEVKGDLWKFHEADKWVCITTNGTVRKDGRLVMGRGCALEAALKFPDLSKYLGSLVKGFGNIPLVLEKQTIITFPVKYHWHEKANLNLIIQSAHMVKKIVDMMELKELHIPRPGCGNGKLDWSVVKPELKKIFTDDRFIIVSFKGEI